MATRETKVLFYDLELTPILGWAYGTYETDIRKIEQDWFIVSFSYKWGHQKTTHFVGMWEGNEWKSDKTNDIHCARELHKLFDEADVIVAHNGDKFDRKKANTRFLKHGMLPPSPYHTIDTLKVARREFGNTYNGLNALGYFLGLGTKENIDLLTDTIDAYKGMKPAQKRLKKYNNQDVKLLEKVFHVLKPWDRSMPNLHPEKPLACTACGSDKVSPNQIRYSRSGIPYQRWRCKSCGSSMNSRARESAPVSGLAKK